VSVNTDGGQYLEQLYIHVFLYSIFQGVLILIYRQVFWTWSHSQSTGPHISTVQLTTLLSVYYISVVY